MAEFALPHWQAEDVWELQGTLSFREYGAFRVPVGPPDGPTEWADHRISAVACSWQFEVVEAPAEPEDTGDVRLNLVCTSEEPHPFAGMAYRLGLKRYKNDDGVLCMGLKSVRSLKLPEPEEDEAEAGAGKGEDGDAKGEDAARGEEAAQGEQDAAEGGGKGEEEAAQGEEEAEKQPKKEEDFGEPGSYLVRNNPKVPYFDVDKELDFLFDCARLCAAWEPTEEDTPSRFKRRGEEYEEFRAETEDGGIEYRWEVKFPAGPRMRTTQCWLPEKPWFSSFTRESIYEPEEGEPQPELICRLTLVEEADEEEEAPADAPVPGEE